MSLISITILARSCDDIVAQNTMWTRWAENPTGLHSSLNRPDLRIHRLWLGPTPMISTFDRGIHQYHGWPLWLIPYHADQVFHPPRSVFAIDMGPDYSETRSVLAPERCTVIEVFVPDRSWLREEGEVVPKPILKTHSLGRHGNACACLPSYQGMRISGENTEWKTYLRMSCLRLRRVMIHLKNSMDFIAIWQHEEASGLSIAASCEMELVRFI